MGKKEGGQVSSRLDPHGCINLKQILLFRLEVVNERELEVLAAQIKTEVGLSLSVVSIELVACVAQPSNLCEESEVLCNVDRNTWTNTNVPCVSLCLYSNSCVIILLFYLVFEVLVAEASLTKYANLVPLSESVTYVWLECIIVRRSISLLRVLKTELYTDRELVIQLVTEFWDKVDSSLCIAFTWILRMKTYTTTKINLSVCAQ